MLWLDGDSALTLPGLSVRHPDLRFDLVHIDGDHSGDHELTDLRNGWALTGRVLVCHDTNVEEVREAWDAFIKEAEGLGAHATFDTGRGTGVALRD